MSILTMCNVHLNKLILRHHTQRKFHISSRKFELNTKIFQKNIFEQKNLETDIIVARAFKPLKIILELIHNKAENWKKIFIYLGKTGKNELLQASKRWDIEYKQRDSITSNDSIVIEVIRLKKK